MAPGLPESLEELHHVMPRPAVEFATQSPTQGNVVEAAGFHSVRTQVRWGCGLRSRRIQVDMLENDDAPKAEEEVHADPTL